MKQKILTLFLILALLPSLLGATLNIGMEVYTDVFTPIGSEVMNVIMPSNVNFTVDPFELNGNGQVYSDVFWIENKSDTSIFLSFTGVNVTFANDYDFEFVPYRFDSIDSDLKSIYLEMNFRNGSIPPVVLTDYSGFSETTIKLEPYDMLPFSFSGTVNPNPAVAWETGDVNICLTYTMTYAGDQLEFQESGDTSAFYLNPQEQPTETEKITEFTEYAEITEAEESAETNEDGGTADNGNDGVIYPEYSDEFGTAIEMTEETTGSETERN